MTQRTDLYGAIDLGGTKLRAVVGDLSGNISGQRVGPSATEEGLDAVVERMAEYLEAAARKAGLEVRALGGVGIASPGAVDNRRGIVPWAPQLPGWHDVPLVEIMTRRLGIPAWLENDATAATLGENVFGAGRDASEMLYLTISTGIGGGIIANGKLYTGASGGAGEFGHVIVDMDGPECGCGSHGCLESVSSGTSIARRGQELVDAGEAPILAGLSRHEGAVTSEMMARAASQGDAASRAAYQEAGVYLGVALAGFVNIFNPELIVLGGGVMKAAHLFLDDTRRTMEKTALRQPLKDVRLKLAELGDRAGPLGMIARLRDVLSEGSRK